MSLSKAMVIALSYGQQLADHGKVLTLPQNSEFVPLVRSATPTIDCVDGCSSEYFLGSIADQSGGFTTATEFEEISGGMKDGLVTLVRDHIRVSQEVIGVTVEGVSKIAKYRESLPDSSALSRFSIIQDPLPDVFESTFFQDTILASTPSVIRNPTMALTTRPRTNEELLALLVTDDKELSKGLNQALMFFSLNDYGRPRNVLEDIYMGFFCGYVSQSPFYNFAEFKKLPTGERLTVALMVYLIAEKLNANTPPDAVGSLNEFNENCKNAMSVMHSSMITSFQEKKYQVENGILVINLHANVDSAIVDKSSYLAFLEAGGTPEAILGAKVAYLPFFSAKEIAENLSACMNAWNTYANLNTAVAENELQDYLRATYKAVWSELGETGPEFEMVVRKENMTMFGEATKTAFKWIDEQTLETLEDHQKTMEYLIGHIRFGYTPASLYMKHMKANRLANPDSGSREDALVATIKYLSAFVLTQIRAVDV